jgi:glycosyltransferase involved in cell wall biosynthesis
MSKKPIIALVAHDVGGIGGMESHLEETINRLKREAEVVVVAASMKLKDPSGVRFIRIPVMNRPAPLKILLFSILATLRILFLKRDLLHTTGAIVFNRAEISTVHFCHAGYMKETNDTRWKHNQSRLLALNSKLASKLSLWMEKVIYHPKRTKKLVAVSKRVQSELLEAFPYTSEEIAVIPNGVNVEAFYPYEPLRKSALRKELGLPEKERLLLFMGGDWAIKGLGLVLKAFEQIAPEYPDTRLLVVGKGSPKQYEDMVSPLYRERIMYTGRQPNPQDWFGISDIFVFPSSYETFSLVVHEAAAAGLAIIATSVGGVEDLIEHRVSGLIVGRDEDEIASALRETLSGDCGLRYGEQARLRVQGLTWDHTHLLFIQLYESFLHGQFRLPLGSRGFEVERVHS